MKIEWLGHAAFVLKDSKTIYIDPFKIKAGEKADIILITHSHFDHCSLPDIEKIRGKDTIVIGPKDCKVAGIKAVAPGQTLKVGDVTIETVPAYNTNKDFHKRSNGWVGYVVRMDGISVYHSGDSDFIPEMKALRDIDYALVPVGGTYTMTAEEAAAAVNSFRPKVAFPMHYGSIVVPMPMLCVSKNSARAKSG